ncbi:MAG TPA: hypothetical protein VHV08_08185 [Pirellulales bacterium]|jgi:hypothetical protein|nr:hypothetical protein [Pirellulales bacterium]
MANSASLSAVSQPPRSAIRALVSLLVMLHVGAVFLGPWATPPQTSELAMTFARVAQPYLDALWLSNGYRFFAPEPGPSHLVRYELSMDDGSTQQGFLPDRAHHQPRLLYHRYFMLTEFINTLENPAIPRERAEAYAKSYAAHLIEAHHARSAKLFLVRHYIPRMYEVRQGMSLTNKALYEERLLGEFEREGS